eukprot:gene13156-9002_t
MLTFIDCSLTCVCCVLKGFVFLLLPGFTVTLFVHGVEFVVRSYVDVALYLHAGVWCFSRLYLCCFVVLLTGFLVKYYSYLHAVWCVLLVGVVISQVNVRVCVNSSMVNRSGALRILGLQSAFGLHDLFGCTCYAVNLFVYAYMGQVQVWVLKLLKLFYVNVLFGCLITSGLCRLLAVVGIIDGHY